MSAQCQQSFVLFYCYICMFYVLKRLRININNKISRAYSTFFKFNCSTFLNSIARFPTTARRLCTTST